MDKSDFVNFVNSVQWHFIILMKTTRLNGDIDRAARGVCDIRPEGTECKICIRIFIDQR